MQILPITVFLSMQLFKYPEWKLSFFFPPLPFFFFFFPVWSWGASAPQEYKRLGWVSFFFFFLLPFSSVSLWLIQTPGIYLFFLRDLGMFASSAVFHFISKGKGELKKKTTNPQTTNLLYCCPNITNHKNPCPGVKQGRLNWRKDCLPSHWAKWICTRCFSIT